MTIKELYKKLQNNFDSDELKGSFTLHGSSIRWEYNLYDSNSGSKYEKDFDGEIEPDFESESIEEQLNEACNDDLDLIEVYLDELGEYDNCEISESEIDDNTISFTIC